MLANSADNSFHEDAYQNEETFVSEQGQGSDDDQAIRIQPRSSYINYQSFMDKTPSTRWSKQDTELFYEVNLLEIIDFHWKATILYQFCDCWR